MTSTRQSRIIAPHRLFDMVAFCENTAAYEMPLADEIAAGNSCYHPVMRYALRAIHLHAGRQLPMGSKLILSLVIDPLDGHDLLVILRRPDGTFDRAAMTDFTQHPDLVSLRRHVISVTPRKEIAHANIEIPGDLSNHALFEKYADLLEIQP